MKVANYYVRPAKDFEVNEMTQDSVWKPASMLKYLKMLQTFGQALQDSCVCKLNNFYKFSNFKLF